MILLLVSCCMLSPALERGEEFDDLTSEADDLTSEPTHAAAWTENTRVTLTASTEMVNTRGN